MEVENLQSVLQDAGINVDLKTLQNPTEEFMINLVIEYLKKFHFDGNEVAKPTPEQLDCVSCEESATNAIKAINLHAALATICEEIFLKDLTLTDITSPGFKKSCKRIKVLFNFFVYVRNKKMENEHLFLELDNRQKEILDMIEGKGELSAKIGSIVHEREAKSESIKNLKKEILDVKLQMEKNEKVRRKLQSHVEEVTAKHQEELHKFNALKAKAHDLHKITKDLKTKIVSSPEGYMARSKELKKLLEEKMEERQIVNDGINRKKIQIENNELAEDEVKKCHKKMMNTGEIMRNLKEIALQISTTKKQLDELKEEIISLERKPSSGKADSRNSITVDLEENQRVLLELHNMQSEKQRELEMLKTKQEELRTEQENAKIRLQKQKESILLAQKEYNSLSKDLKNYFKNEISEEMNFREDLNQALK